MGAVRQTGGGAGRGPDSVTGDFLSSCFVSFADWIYVCLIVDLSVTCPVQTLGRIGFCTMHLGDVRPPYIGSQTICVSDNMALRFRCSVTPFGTSGE